MHNVQDRPGLMVEVVAVVSASLRNSLPNQCKSKKSMLLAEGSAAWNSNASVLNLVEIARTLVIHRQVSKPERKS